MTTGPTNPSFSQGDFVVIFVPFPKQPPVGTTPDDLEAYLRNGFWGKDRPVVIVSAERHNRAEDLLVALITSGVAKARRRGEYVLKRWSEVKLTRESAIRPRLFQVIKSDIVSRLGTIHPDDRHGMLAMLRDLLEV